MFNRRVLESLEEVKNLLRNKLSEILILKEENKRLTEVNERLMDRLMSKDFSEYRVYSSGDIEIEKAPDLAPEYDESLAGETVEVNK